MEANFHNGSSSYPFYRWSRRGVALVLVMMVHLSVVADGFVPTAMTHMTRSFSGTSFVSMYATVERTTRASNAFGEEDDDDEEDDEDIEDDEVDLMVNVHDENFILAMKRPSTATSKTESQRRRQKKQKTQNPAMHDTQFLRKRTNDLLAATEAESTSQNVLLGRRFKVDRKTFHFLLDAWAFSNEIDASHQAQRLLSRMEEIGGTVTPDVRSYTKTINAIARSGEIDAGEQAEAILEKMKRLYKESLTTNPELASSVKPNSYTYTAVIQAHAGSGAPGSAQKAHALIKKAIEKNQRGDDDVKPTCKAFLAVISAYGKAGDATSAETIFRKMERTFQSGIRDCKPNVYTYNALISAYANCEGTEAKAAEVLAQLESLYETTRDPDLQPTTVSYNAVIDAYAKAGEPNAAEEILRRMETFDIRSNTRSFNSVLNAWAKSRDPDAALHAEDLFELMNQLYHKGNPDVRPDLHSYCTVINAWARSGRSIKAERAYNLYKDMKTKYKAGATHLRPNVVAVNAVMNACAYTINGDLHQQNRAVEIAHSVLKDLEREHHLKPDQVTYGTFLKVCANQMPDSHTRQQVVEVVFKKCCRDGQVGNMVLTQLHSLASPELYQSLVGRSIHEPIQMEDVPKEWWCNVVECKWRRKRNYSG